MGGFRVSDRLPCRDTTRTLSGTLESAWAVGRRAAPDVSRSCGPSVFRRERPRTPDQADPITLDSWESFDRWALEKVTLTTGETVCTGLSLLETTRLVSLAVSPAPSPCFVFRRDAGELHRVEDVCESLGTGEGRRVRREAGRDL